MITSKFNELSPSTYVNLLSDSGFKAVYLDKSNKNLLIELLNCILPAEARVRDIESYEDRERDADIIGGKRTYLDLVCVGKDGRRFAVEIQRAEEAAFFERCIYYAGDVYHKELTEGDFYTELKPVYIISILNYNLKHKDESLWDTDNFIARYRMIEERTSEFAPPTIFAIFAETKRFTKTLSECSSDRDYLFYWFLNGWRYDKGGLPKELEGTPITKTLSRACEIAAFTPEKKTLYNKSLMNERDILAQKDFAVKEALAKGLAEGRTEGLAEGEARGEAKGRAEGLKEGLAEGKRETAKKLLSLGDPIEKISIVTGLSHKEIQCL